MNRSDVEALQRKLVRQRNGLAVEGGARSGAEILGISFSAAALAATDICRHDDWLARRSGRQYCAENPWSPMIEELISRWGYLGFAVGTFFEGETVLVVGGALAHKGLMSLPGVALSAFMGSLLGDQFWFLIGWRTSAEVRTAAAPRRSVCGKWSD